MSNNKMLIDATHPEETRVVVLRNGRVEEFDFESAARKLLRGNIYLAKVTRVEPSLQAAFVDYGGNRHGFLAFNEIHPDYYQIPVADRQALIEEEAAQEAAEEAEVDAHAERLARRRQGRSGGSRDRSPLAGDGSDGDHGAAPEGAGMAGPADDHDHNHGDDAGHETHHTMAAHAGEIEQIITEPAPPVSVGGFDPGEAGLPHEEPHEHDDPGRAPARSDDDQSDHGHQDRHAQAPAGQAEADHDHEHGHDHGLAHANGHEPHEHDGEHVDHQADGEAAPAPELIEPAGNDDSVEEMVQRPRRRPRSYKIQEVIKRRQIILVQVVKEERGNKGAALTTYLSLAGRYTVLMPNTARGGGISRKITQPGDRKRLKAIANELEVPEGMGLIIRTAGAARTSQEIKRDFEYLLRLWESVRQLTLESTAPSLVYEEGNLIKRSIRDLYNKDVEEIVVAGDVAYHEAHDFMRMLMPSHAKNVIQHKGAEPLFTRYRMEQQLAAMFSPTVTLKSGGYIVINQTEALVAIDVNSGKSTREYSIEETALNTNLEASDEIARQLKLRDLAGLIVIDFIDMEEKRNNRNVERRLKDALRFDRARIQLGRISHFGLMEMSRQRLRTGVLEGSTTQCPHCQGTGIIRSIESIALAVIRGLEDALMSGTRMALVATTTPTVALYILNSKRAYITEMEARHGLSITVQGSDKLQGANFTIDKVAVTTAETPLRRRSSSAVNMEWGFDGEEGDEPASDASLAELVPYNDTDSDEDGETEGRSERQGQRDGRTEPRDGETAEEGRRRRRRRGRRGRRDERPAGEGAIAGAAEGPRGGAETGDEDGDDRQGRIIEIGADDGEPELIGGGGEDGESQPDDSRQTGEGEGEAQRRGRRRGRRGGRRGGQNRERAPLAANDSGQDAGAEHPGPMAAHSDQPANDHAGDGATGDHRATDEAGPYGERHDDTHTAVAAPRYQPPEPHEKARPQPAVATLAAAPTAVEPAPVAAAAPAPSAPPAAPAVAEPKPRRVASTSSEPVLERVVVTPHAGAEASQADTEAKPVRKGWWQRKLGLE